jgi:hypothetical protein
MPSNVFVMRFSQEQLQLVAAGVQELQYKVAAPLLHEINRQANTKIDPCAACDFYLAENQTCRHTATDSLDEDIKAVALARELGGCVLRKSPT